MSQFGIGEDDPLNWGWGEAGWHFPGRSMERNASCLCKGLMVRNNWDCFSRCSNLVAAVSDFMLRIKWQCRKCHLKPHFLLMEKGKHSTFETLLITCQRYSCVCLLIHLLSYNYLFVFLFPSIHQSYIYP